MEIGMWFRFPLNLKTHVLGLGYDLSNNFCFLQPVSSITNQPKTCPNIIEMAQRATCVIHLPVPSASSKIIFTTFKFFWACSIFFEHSQIFWSWSKARFYLINLHIWAWSKIFEHIQKILNTVKYIWTWSKNIWTSRWIRH